MAKDVLSRNFCGILYFDTESYNIEDVFLRFDEVFTEYALCVHDKDTDENGELKKIHCHFVGKRKTPTSLSGTATKLGIPANYLQFCKSFKGSVRYLIHADDLDKYQYDPDLIEANFDVSSLLASVTENQKVSAIYREIVVNQNYSITSLSSFCIENDLWSEFRRGFNVWKNIIEEMRVQ